MVPRRSVRHSRVIRESRGVGPGFVMGDWHGVGDGGSRRQAFDQMVDSGVARVIALGRFELSRVPLSRGRCRDRRRGSRGYG